MTIHLSSRVFVKEIYTLLIFPRERLPRNIMQRRLSRQLLDLLNCFIWIYSVLKIMLAWEATSMVSILLMISLVILGKSKVVDIFKTFAKRAQTEYEVSLKHIRSDRGTEFKNTHIEDFLDT